MGTETPTYWLLELEVGAWKVIFFLLHVLQFSHLVSDIPSKS